jgi:two-component system, NarL family, sensor kinase
LLGGLTSVLLLAALALDLHTGSYRQLLYVVIAETLTLIGALLTTRKPEQPISWGFGATALLWAVGAGAYAYAVEALVADPSSLPGGLAAAWLDNWFWLPTLVLPISLLLLAVPDGRLLSPSWRPVLIAVIGGTGLASAGLSGSSTFELGSSETIDNPLAFDTTAARLVAAIGFAVLAGAVVASLVSFVLRYRRCLGEERQQLRWIGGSLGISACFGALGAVTWGVFPYAFVLDTFALLVLPVGTAVAILKYRLYEIDLVVNRAFVYGAMTVCVVTSYVLVVGLVGATLSDRGDLVLSLALTGVVAVCFQPLRERATGGQPVDVRRARRPLRCARPARPPTRDLTRSRCRAGHRGRDNRPDPAAPVCRAHAVRQRRGGGRLRHAHWRSAPLPAPASGHGRRRAPARSEGR